MYEKLSPLFREAMIGLTDSIVNGEIVPKKLAAQAAVASWPQQAYAVQGQIQSQVPIAAWNLKACWRKASWCGANLIRW